MQQSARSVKKTGVIMTDFYYLVSVKHTRDEDPYITFWRPANQGYCWSLGEAGKYDYETIIKDLDYYCSDNTFPVPCSRADDLGIKPGNGYDSRAGQVVVQNNEENMNRLRAAAFIAAQTGTR